MNLTSKANRRFSYIDGGTATSLHTAQPKPSLVLSHFPGLHRVRGMITSTWLLVLPALLLVALFSLPLLALTARAVNAEFFNYVLSEQAVHALQLSLSTSLITVLFTIFGGTPLAYMLARWKFSHKPLLELLIDLPIVLPPSVAGIALLIAFGRQGTFGQIMGSLHISLPFTTAAVVVAQTFVAAPLYVRAARIGFSDIDIQIEEAARVEGANQWQLFRHVMFPLSRRALVTGAILAWTRSLGEFGATMLFAGNLEGVTQTMPMAIYLGFERNLGMAVALSVVLIGISVILLSMTRYLEKRTC